MGKVQEARGNGKKEIANRKEDTGKKTWGRGSDDTELDLRK